MCGISPLGEMPHQNTFVFKRQEHSFWHLRTRVRRLRAAGGGSLEPLKHTGQKFPFHSHYNLSKFAFLRLGSCIMPNSIFLNDIRKCAKIRKKCDFTDAKIITFCDFSGHKIFLRWNYWTICPLCGIAAASNPVSYTHLTLPTIYSV